MKKVKKHTKVRHASTRRQVSRKAAPKLAIYGIEHEFIIITGGGFLVIVLAILLFFH